MHPVTAQVVLNFLSACTNTVILFMLLTRDLLLGSEAIGEHEEAGFCQRPSQDIETSRRKFSNYNKVRKFRV